MVTAAHHHAVSGSVSIPVLWLAIGLLILAGVYANRAGSKGVGWVLILIGVVVLFTTPAGHNLKDAAASLLQTL